MFKLFTSNNPLEANNLNIKFPLFDYIKRRYLETAKDYLNYYGRLDSRVENINILNRLMKDVMPAGRDDKIEYFKQVDSIARHRAAALGFVTDSMPGKIIYNNMYRSNSAEIYVYVENNIDIINIEKNWKDLNPIRCTYTDVCNIDMYPMNGTKDLYGNNVSIFEVDVIMLMMCYREWRKEQVEGDTLLPAKFLATYALPRLGLDTVDLLLFNRLMKIYNREAIIENRFKSPVYFQDYTKGVDDVLNKVAKTLTNRPYRVENILRNIPTINSDNMYQRLMLGKKTYTNRSNWVWYYSRTKMANFILDFIGSNGKKANLDKTTSMPYEFRKIDNRNTTIRETLPKIYLKDWEDQYKLLKSKI